MNEQQPNKIIKSLLFDIAHTWLGQDTHNCEDRRNEKLPRYYFRETEGDHFHYEMWLWIGTSLEIDCSDHEIPEDWTGPRPPIKENAEGCLLGIILGTRPSIKGQRIPAAHYIQTFDTLGILPDPYKRYHKDINDLDDIQNNLIELRHLIEAHLYP